MLNLLHSWRSSPNWVVHLWTGAKFFFRLLMNLTFVIFLIFFIPFAIGNFLLATPRVHAYRNLHPSLPPCQEGLDKGWTILAESNGDDGKSRQSAEEEGWIDPTNDENAAVGKDRK